MGYDPRKIEALKGTGAGRFLIIQATGPSIRSAQLERLKGHPKIDTLGINRPYPPLWPTTHWVFCDQSTYASNEDVQAAWQQYDGNIFNTPQVTVAHPNKIKLQQLNGRGFSGDISKGVHIGGSSAYVALQVGVYLGYDHIFMFGVDHGLTHESGQPEAFSHWWGRQAGLGMRMAAFENEAKYWSWAGKFLSPAVRDTITFSTPAQDRPLFADYFSRVPHSLAVDYILEVCPS